MTAQTVLTQANFEGIENEMNKAELIDAVANGEAVVITRSETKPVQCRVESEN